MTGADIIAVIILIGLAIAIAVYLLHWLYRRSSKEVSFVRSGLGGEKVVISGGAFRIAYYSQCYYCWHADIAHRGAKRWR